jgi:uncharacterized protein
MESTQTYLAFSGARCIARGPLPDVLPVLKQRFERDRSETILVFEVESGRQVDFDLRGTVEEVLERATATPAKGPGRPKLGVSSREVSLLPRHWDWLEQQPSGISSALRKLVDQAMRSQSTQERSRALRDALCRFLTSMAGDRPNFEEAIRALYAGDSARFAELVDRWPKDIREHAIAQEQGAAALAHRPHEQPVGP